MNVSELEGPELDYWVAKAIGYSLERRGHADCWVETSFRRDFGEETAFVCQKMDFLPSTDWSQAGPLIDEHRILLMPHVIANWQAQIGVASISAGPTPLIAICRALVSSVYGETVGE